MNARSSSSPADADGLLRLLVGRCRLEILSALARRPRTVTDLSGALRVDRTHVTHGLARLREAGLVEFERRGRWKWYRTGECVEVSLAAGVLTMTVRTASGSRLILSLSEAETRQLDWETVTIPGVAGRVPAGRTPPGSRPPSGP